MDLVQLLGWAACVFCAWVGVGNGALTLVGSSARSWPLSGIVGVAFFVLAGGWLNLAGLIYPLTLIVMVAAGDLLFLYQVFRGHSEIQQYIRKFFELSTGSRILAVLCALALLVVAFNSIRFDQFAIEDDLLAYAVFPMKLLQSGSLPFDPFSERRLLSELGASYFLQAFMLVAGDIRSLWFIDAGAGLVLFAGSIYRAGRTLGNSAGPSLALAALVILVPLFHGNLGFTALPAAIFTAIFLVEASGGTSALGGAVLLGLLGATVSLLKSTYLPATLLILPCLYLLRLQTDNLPRVLRNALIAAVVYVVAVLPWMLDMRLKEGTLLYPLLGKGYEISAYGPVPHMAKPGWYPVGIGLAFLLAFATAAIVHWLRARAYQHAAQVSGLQLVCALVALPLCISTAGASPMRYTIPFLFPYTLLILGSLMRIPRKVPAPSWLLPISYAYVGFLILTIEQYAVTHSYFNIYTEPFWPKSEGGSVSLQAANIRREQQRAARLQGMIAPGQSLYADTATFSFDFRRNSIYVADFPGMSSLPPGMPTQGRPADLRTYLLSKSIRFVAYSSKRAVLRERWIPEGLSQTWPRMQRLISLDVDHEIEALAQMYRVIYDDGDDKVIDLEQPLSVNDVSKADAPSQSPS